MKIIKTINLVCFSIVGSPILIGLSFVGKYNLYYEILDKIIVTWKK